MRRLNGGVYFSLIDDNIRDLFPQTFLAGLDAYLKATLPMSYGERYLKLEEKAKQENTYPGRIFVGNFMPSDEQRRLEFTHAVEAGEKFVSSQHGAGYGTARYSSLAAEFEYVYHAFLTWGRKAHDDFRGKFFPVSSPHLSKIKDAHREQNLYLRWQQQKLI